MFPLSISDAVSILNYYGNERGQSQRAKQNWTPDAYTQQEIAEAFDVVLNSDCAEDGLTRAGMELYMCEGSKR